MSIAQDLTILLLKVNPILTLTQLYSMYKKFNAMVVDSNKKKEKKESQWQLREKYCYKYHSHQGLRIISAV